MSVRYFLMSCLMLIHNIITEEHSESAYLVSSGTAFHDFTVLLSCHVITDTLIVFVTCLPPPAPSACRPMNFSCLSQK